MYEKKAAGIRESSKSSKAAISSQERRARRAVADKKYKEKLKVKNTLEKEDGSAVRVKLEQMISSKKEKVDKVLHSIESLKDEISDVKENIKSTANELVKKDIELTCLKEQYKLLHKLHKACNNNVIMN